MAKSHDRDPGHGHDHGPAAPGGHGHGHGEPFVWQPEEPARRTAWWLVGLGLALVAVGALLLWLAGR